MNNFIKAVKQFLMVEARAEVYLGETTKTKDEEIFQAFQRRACNISLRVESSNCFMEMQQRYFDPVLSNAGMEACNLIQLLSSTALFTAKKSFKFSPLTVGNVARLGASGLKEARKLDARFREEFCVNDSIIEFRSGWTLQKCLLTFKLNLWQESRIGAKKATPEVMQALKDHIESVAVEESSVSGDEELLPRQLIHALDDDDDEDVVQDVQSGVQDDADDISESSQSSEDFDVEDSEGKPEKVVSLLTLYSPPIITPHKPNLDHYIPEGWYSRSTPRWFQSLGLPTFRSTKRGGG